MMTSGVGSQYNNMIRNVSNSIVLASWKRKQSSRTVKRSHANPDNYQHNQNHTAMGEALARSYSSAAAPMNTAAAKAVLDSWRSETAAPVWAAEEALELPEAEEPPELVPEEPELDDPVACEPEVEAAVTKPEPVVVVALESEVLVVPPEEELDSSVRP